MMQDYRQVKAVRIIVNICISVIIFVLSITFGNIQYEANDDTIINLIAAGAYGEPSQYLVHNGILFGYFIKILYKIFPYVNCYLILYLVLNLLSMIVLCHVLSSAFMKAFSSSDKKRSGWKDIFWTGVITVEINLLLVKDFYINLQYTKNGEIYAVIGILLIISIVGKKYNYFGRLVLGACFLALGLLVRKESFIQVLPLAIIALAFSVIIKRKKLDFSLKWLSRFIIPLGACLLVLGTNFVAFDLNKDWSDFYKWDAIMVQKRDYGNYYFDWCKEDYLANGFTEWDFRLMEEWMWNDCDNFPLEKLQLMAEIGKGIKMNRLRFEPELITQTWELLREAWSESLLPLVALLVVIISVIVCCIKRNWLGLIGCMAEAGGGLFEIYYLACLRRYPWRVEFGIWFATIFFMLATVVFTCTGIEVKKVNWKLSIAAHVVVFACVIASIFGWQQATLDYTHKSWDYRDNSRYEYIKSINNTDGLFVMSINEMFGGLCGAGNIWDINKRDFEGFYQNIIPSGGWIIPSPIGMYYAHENGISNVFKAFSERDDIYYLGGGETMGYLLMYQNEKYGPGISVTDVEFDWGTAWKFYR